MAFDKFGQGYFLFEEFEKTSGSMNVYVSPKEKRLPVAKHLTDAEYIILVNTYFKHNRSMGLSDRDNYSISNVVKVKVAVPNKVIEVYYDNGDWWHYTSSGEWY